MVGAILLNDLGDDLVAAPCGYARIEDFRIVVAEVWHCLGQGAATCCAAGTAANVHRKFTRGFVNGRRNAIHRKCDYKAHKKEHEY